MVLATINSGLYKLCLVLHILCAIVGFGALFLNGIYGSPDTGAVAVEITINVLTIALGAVVVAWALWQRRALMSLR